MKNWIFLSHELSENLSSYANGQRISIEAVNLISEGKTSNTSLLHLPSHFGTHIDFPYHFSQNGSNGSNYDANIFVFNEIKLVELNNFDKNNLLLSPKDFYFTEIEKHIELLLIKINKDFSRDSENYWENNVGFSPECAEFFKKFFPNLRSVGFDSISLSSFKHREIGRVAHKEFLMTQNLLIIEDMDLSKVSEKTIFKQIIISPLRFFHADGSPVTIFAQIDNEN